MSFIYRFQLLSFVSVLLTLAAGQTCYYPDQSVAATDVPCGSNSVDGSSCCPQDSFCMSNGLCFDGGLLSRGSCADKTWQSDACSKICLISNPSRLEPLTPCSKIEFTCGLNTTGCYNTNNTFTLPSGNQLVLRPTQVAALLASETTQPSISSPSNSSSTTSPAGSCSGSSSEAKYTRPVVLAVALGLGLPLLMATVASLIMFRRLHLSRKPKTMYNPPDDHPLPILPRGLSSRPSMSTIGRSPTIHTIDTMFTTQSQMPKAFQDKYGDKLKEALRKDVQEMDVIAPRYELRGSTPDYVEVDRAEVEESSPITGRNSLVPEHSSRLSRFSGDLYRL